MSISRFRHEPMKIIRERLFDYFRSSIFNSANNQISYMDFSISLKENAKRTNLQLAIWMLLQNNDGTLWINLSTVHLAEYASDLSNAKLPRLLKLVDQNKRGRTLKATKDLLRK